MADIDNFRQLLQYFVAHLELCNKNLRTWKDKTPPPETTTRGYSRFIEDYVNSDCSGDWKLFMKTSRSSNLLNQIAKWSTLSVGKIGIGINTTGKNKYKSNTNFINWDGTWQAIRAQWDKDIVKSLSITVGEKKNEKFTKILDLDVLDNLYKNNDDVIDTNSKDLIAFWKKFVSLAPKSDQVSTHPLNLILYGPPGTGKTYNTLFKALEIIEGKTKKELEAEKKVQDEKWEKDTNDPKKEKKGYELLKERYDRYVETGQIVFTTFHQSMSYEDFIEGIKPIPIEGEIKAIHENDPESKKTLFGDGTTTISNLSRMKYDVRDGIFKKIADSANKNRQESDVDGEKIISVQKLLNAFCDYAEDNNEGTYLMNNGEKWHEIVPRRKDNEDRDVLSFVINYGSRQHLTFSIINRDWESFKKGKIETAYDIKPQRGSQSRHGNAIYYYALYDALKAFEQKYNPTNQNDVAKQNYVLIIDEINRGNVAQIFGELITLIEPSKRLGNDEAMTATLPYSSTIDPDAESFGVPNNLYIIGTMNTADRSVEALDTALRRRFSFEEMMPDYSLLKNETLCGVNLSVLLKTINERITVLKDREHQIGHSYFMGLKTDSDLKNVFKDKIIPLLQEYFYGDYKKIYYVLGPGFVEKKTEKTIFAVENPDVYELDIPEERYDIVSFDANFDIKGAIEKMEVQKLDSNTVPSIPED